MISLSPALPPAAPRVSGGTAAAALPGDFAAALAGLLVPEVDGADPPVLPAEPTDRQIAAVPGKGLPDIAASGDVRLTEGADTIAVVLPVPPARVLTPFPPEKAARSPNQPAPPVLPLQSQRTLAPTADIVETDTTAKSATPADPDMAVPPAGDGEDAAPPRRVDAAEQRASYGRAQTRKDAIAALPLPIPTITAAAAPVAMAAVPIAAPTIAHDVVAPAETRPAVSMPARGRAVESGEHEVRPARADGTSLVPTMECSSSRAPIADLAGPLPAPSGEPSSPDSDPVSDAVPEHGATVSDRAAMPMILEMIVAPAVPEVAPTAPRPLRFAATLPAAPAIDAPPSPAAGRGPEIVATPARATAVPPIVGVATVAPPVAHAAMVAVPVAHAATIAPPETPASVATALQATATMPIDTAPRRAPPVVPNAVSQAAAPATPLPHPTRPPLRADAGVASAPPLVAPLRDLVDPMPATDRGPATAPAPDPRPASSASVAAAAARIDPPGRPEALAVARAPASSAIAQPAAAESLQQPATRHRPLPIRPASGAAQPLGHEAPAADPAIMAAHPLTTAPSAEQIAIHRTPLDMRRDDWTQQLIERIERVRDIADAADTRIKLAPDALGKIDVSMRKDGVTVHVTFTADVAQTRAMLVEAQPRLAELAAQRGLRLGQSSVDAGAGGQNQHQQQAAGSPAPLPSRPVAARDEDSTETGRVA